MKKKVNLGLKGPMADSRSPSWLKTMNLLMGSGSEVIKCKKH